MKRQDNELLIGKQSAVLEARGLYQMLGRDRNTVESLRELIAIPPNIELACCAASSWRIPRMLSNLRFFAHFFSSFGYG